MGSFIAWLVLDVTPVSIDWKKDILLGYVEPEQHGGCSRPARSWRPRA